MLVWPGYYLAFRFTKQMLTNAERKIQIDSQGIQMGARQIAWNELAWIGCSRLPGGQRVKLLYRTKNPQEGPMVMEMNHGLTLPQYSELMERLKTEVGLKHAEIEFGVQRSWFAKTMAMVD
jgi:hypothetical protein